ncbi:C4-dicarboxylate anaerobic carrier [[Clostridium] sordellii]|uniref:YfcC family protein n=1 Tax=Paraclostridium sordellii TaxID=1505 RepID=UPI0005DD79CF|nr:YfcC family protein [Paeniclostridium sordellii]MBX9181290.1 YfcC family protein [Paeniclostridium sordellii]MDU2148476.1 YfcC family protein [Paeniclostridium sordellii]CEO14241.1 C4-dicarboxylate anaerobic carrier [[Clostridium] sordellii] [Paeniclostridium sordellii]CEP43909.1 C4-dicarboxylate anaerobic carrier [[Clostridium] sordellii] [Paeniclostridium sordellii]CEP82906.1 C4-dicarboxylate anaerobic carrier [[Clostridium] sordellii] [Paeniclostridium sordellii]
MSKLKKKLTIPHTFTIIFLLIVVIAVLTWIIPSGEFQRVKIDGRMVVKPGTYHKVAANPQGIKDIFLAPIDGFIDAAEVVGFVLLVGGAFGIVNKTGAIESGINHTVKKLNGLEVLIIPVSMILFGLGGSTFGMNEETLPFYMIFIPLMTNLGYDTLTAISTVFLGSGSGVLASTINPFSVGIAQALSNIAPGSGIGYRTIIFIVILSISISFVMMYARKIKRDPKESIVYELDQANKKHFIMDESNIKPFTLKEGIVLTIFICGMGIMVYGVLKMNWYIPEIAMIFSMIGVFSGLFGGLKQNEIVDAFLSGASDLVSAALAIALARGIVIVAQNGHIIDTLLNYSADALSKLPKFIFINLSFALESFMAFLIPSSSGLASLTIPVLSPLSDLVGVSSQLIVTAYQFGTGLINLITPTSGVLMGALAFARVPWSKWVRFIAPLFGMIILACIAFLTIGLYIGY